MVTMKNGVFWDVTPCGSCKKYQLVWTNANCCFRMAIMKLSHEGVWRSGDVSLHVLNLVTR
jgi:hypothetical protein